MYAEDEIRMPECVKEQLKGLGYTKLTISHHKLFNQYYDQMNDYWSSPTCFIEMLVFGETVSAWFKETEDLLICVEWDAVSGELVSVPFFGHYTDESVEKAYRILKADMDEMGIPIVFMDLTDWMEPFIERIPGTKWNIINDRDLMDYLFTPAAFLEGMNQKDDRYRYRYFLRKFDHEIVEMDKSQREEIRDFFKRTWCKDHTCDFCHYGCLMDCVDRLMEHFEEFHARGILIRVDGECAGFCTVSVYRGLAIYQFKNAINRMKGINEVLLRECFDRFLQDVEVINYTEDMGEEKLRAYKQRLGDYTLGSRYRLELL